MEPYYQNIEASIIGKLDAQERRELKKQAQIKQHKSAKKKRDHYLVV